MHDYDLPEEGEVTAAEETSRANADVVPAPPSLWTRLTPSLPRFSRRALVWTGSCLMAFVLLTGAGVAYATYDFSKEYRGLIFPGMHISGVDVGGLDRAQAIAQVRTALADELGRTISLRWRGRAWDVTPKQAGARTDVKSVVDSALHASNTATFFEKARMRVFGSGVTPDRSVAITYPRRGVLGFLEGLASGFDREARDATVDYSTGWVEVVPERDGRSLQIRKTFHLLDDALESGAEAVPVVVQTEKPQVKAEAFAEVLLLRIGENKLYLYEDGKITHEWPVATGQPEYPTPTGIYEITEKRYMPTWVNPDPTGWGASMPLSIPPGPGNPLGLRALNWSAEAIRFHGTSATYSLGYNASHGCVRMSNEDVIAFYDMIDVGTAIVSTVVAPLKPLYVSAPDPTVVEEDSGEAAPGTDEGKGRDDNGGNNEGPRRKSG